MVQYQRHQPHKAVNRLQRKDKSESPFVECKTKCKDNQRKNAGRFHFRNIVKTKALSLKRTVIITMMIAIVLIMQPAPYRNYLLNT